MAYYTIYGVYERLTGIIRYIGKASKYVARVNMHHSIKYGKYPIDKFYIKPIVFVEINEAASMELLCISVYAKTLDNITGNRYRTGRSQRSRDHESFIKSITSTRN